MRVRITKVENPKNAPLIGREVDGESGYHNGRSGIKFLFKGRMHFLDSTMYQVIDYCDHIWCDTGMKITWCNKCDAEGHHEMGFIVVKKKSKEAEDDLLPPFLD